MNMRPSRVLNKLRNGEVVSCCKLNLDSFRVAEIAAMCGYDCIWTDMEHIPTDWSLMESQILAAKTRDVDTMVRISRGCYSDYIRPLEADAAGIMVPHVMSLEDAKNVVKMTRFHPVGLRPLDGGNADGAYCCIPFLDYIEQANRERFVAVQIEDPEPLDELEEIAALDGIDMLFFGPADFSHGIGAPGQWNDPRIAETLARVAKVAAKHGKYAGTPGSLDTLNDLVGMGYRFISIGADVVGLTSYFSAMVSEYRKLISGGVK